MRKLPVMAAFSHAFRSTTNNLAFAFHASWPWMAVLLPVLIAGNLYVFAETGGDPEQQTPGSIAASIAIGVISMLSFASIAVSWHRYVLLDEMPEGIKRLRVDGTVWRYFGNVLLISVLIGLAGGAAALLFVFFTYITAGVGAIVAIPGIIALLLCAIMAFYRLGVKLPSIALERHDFSLTDAWRITAGNFWQMVGLGILYFLLGAAAALVIAAIGYLLGMLGATLGIALSVSIQLVLQWMLTIFGITILTSLYGFFVENRNF
jgi:hypothetical protein